MYYVMKPNASYAGSYEKLGQFSTEVKAKRFAKGIYDALVWDEQYFKLWHREHIAPHYLR